jgi:hypothetical protein
MDLIRIFIGNGSSLGFVVSPWAVVAVFAVIIVVVILRRRSHKPMQVVELHINLGGIGDVRLRPNWEDIQVAHKIWTELVTRKAAIPIDPDNDVIAEIYDSWYALFQRVRQLLSEIPGQCIRREESTQKLVWIATDTLNLGLRPHLTKWQARFRNWWLQTSDQLETTSPQEHQKDFPEYAELIDDMRNVNGQLIEYASELRKLVHGA